MKVTTTDGLIIIITTRNEVQIENILISFKQYLFYYTLVYNNINIKYFSKINI